MTFKTYAPEDREYLLLKITADILSGAAQHTTFKVEDTYWDLGAGLPALMMAGQKGEPHDP